MLKKSIVGICGCTNSGKTTLAESIQNILGADCTLIIHQDDFYYGIENVNKVKNEKYGKDEEEPEFYYNYDEPASVDVQSLKEKIIKECYNFEYLIIEGNMLSEMQQIMDLCDRVIVMSLDYKTCERRRILREYDPPDTFGYFDRIAWPQYLNHMANAYQSGRKNNKYSFIDVSKYDGVESSIELILFDILYNSLLILDNKLSVDDAVKYVTSPSCGAISTFIGTTRDNFQGKIVQELSYHCYDEMAFKKLRELCTSARKLFPNVEKIAIHHRLGDVPTTEMSVIIATSCPHREESIKSTEYLINELKRTIPIWKKEIYENGEQPSWKSNGKIEKIPENKLSIAEIGQRDFKEQLLKFINKQM